MQRWPKAAVGGVAVYAGGSLVVSLVADLNGWMLASWLTRPLAAALLLLLALAALRRSQALAIAATVVSGLALIVEVTPIDPPSWSRWGPGWVGSSALLLVAMSLLVAPRRTALLPLIGAALVAYVNIAFWAAGASEWLSATSGIRTFPWTSIAIIALTVGIPRLTGMPTLVTDAGLWDRRHLTRWTAMLLAALLMPVLLIALAQAADTVIDPQLSSALLACIAAAGLIGGAVAAIRSEQRSLALAQRQYDTLVAQLPDAVARHAPDGTALWVSARTEEVMGWPADYMLRTPLPELVHPDDLVAVGDAMERVSTARLPTSVQWRLRQPDGTWRFISSRVAAITDDDGSLVELIAVARDVDAAARLSAQLALSESQLRILTDANPVAWALCDGDGIAVRTNPAMTAFLGLDLAGEHWAEAVAPAWRAQALADVQSLRADGDAFERELPFSKSDGDIHWGAVYCARTTGHSGREKYVLTIVDRQAVHEAAEAAALAEERVNAAPLGTALVDEDGVVQRVNPAFATVLGMHADDLIGVALRTLTTRAEPALDATMLAQLARGSVSRSMREWPLRATDMGIRWGHLAVGTLPSDDGPVRYIVQVHDITETRATRLELEEQALRDPLTGLANRAVAMEELSRALARSHRSGRTVAALFCDLDGLKRINDSLGHAAGDRVIAAIGERLRRAVRETDLACRLGGDEYLVIADDLSDAQEAGWLADRILHSVIGPITVEGLEVNPSMSIGIAIAAPGEAAVEVVRHADTAMYRAKAAGRGRWEMFDVGMREHSLARLRLEADLRAHDGQVHAWFQPIVELSTGHVIGAESLARWHHPRLGVLEPGEWLDLAEEIGELSAIGRTIVDETVAWLAANPEAAFATVNVSPKQIARDDIVGMCRGALQRHGVEPRRLVVELTEDAVLGAAASTRAQVHELDACGIQLFIDDFGTGYSALSLVKDLPISGLKLDRTFAPAGGQGQDADIATAVAGLVRTLGLVGIAEGIESPEQARLLGDLGWQYGQGYALGMPTAQAA